MAADREILQEFLTSLGFQVDKPSFKTFVTFVKSACITTARLTATLAGVAVAAEAMATVFARQMEKMYYMSKRTGATVGSLKSLAFGFEQIGLSADDATGLVDNMMSMMRTQPGLQSLMRSLTGNSSEKDPTKLFTGLIRRLAKLPYFIGAQWAEQFGIPEAVYRMLTMPGAMDKLDEARRKQEEMAKQLGLDQEKAAEASKDYLSTLREIWMMVGMVGDKIASELLEPFHEYFAGPLKEWLIDVAHIDFKNMEFSLANVVGFMAEMTAHWTGMPALIREAALAVARYATMGKADRQTNNKDFMKNFEDWWLLIPEPEDIMEFWGAKGAKLLGPGENKLAGTGAPQASGQPSTMASTPGGAATGRSYMRKDLQTMADYAAKSANIPPAIFRALIGQESGWNPNATSEKDSKGRFAYGLTQLRAPAAADMGVDRFDVMQNLMGGARYLASQMGRFGNWRDALAAYNQGAGGNLENGYGYADKIMRTAGTTVTMQQETHIHIASTDPIAAAKAVGAEQSRVNADMLRNAQTRVR